MSSDLAPMNFDEEYVWHKTNKTGKSKNGDRRKKPNNESKSGVAFLQRC